MTPDDVAVQSRGEKRIGDWLLQKKIEYVYDERYRIAGDVSIRPDFYLPEFDLYIEYWGMQEQDYLARKSEKKFLYQRAGKKLISLDWRDLENIEAILEEKLSRYIRSESDKMPPPRRVFGIICPKEAIHRKSIQRRPFHHNEVAVK